MILPSLQSSFCTKMYLFKLRNILIYGIIALILATHKILTSEFHVLLKIENTEWQVAVQSPDIYQHGGKFIPDGNSTQIIKRVKLLEVAFRSMKQVHLIGFKTKRQM